LPAKAVGAGARAGVRGTVGWSSRKALTKFDQAQARDRKSRGAIGRAAWGAIEKLKLDRDARSVLEAGTKVKAGLKYSYADNEAYEEARNKRLTADRASMQRADNIERVVKPPTGAAPITRDDMKKMVDSIKALTTDQMKDMDIELLTKEEVAIHISNKQIDDLEKSGKYSDAQIQQIKQSKKDGIIKVANDPAVGGVMVGTVSQRELLAQRGNDELAKMPIDVFTSGDMAPHLTPDMVEAKMKNGVSAHELSEIRRAIDDELIRYRATPDNPYVKQWRNWDARSTYGAKLGLTIP
jgi:hypothetical protein